MSFQIDNLRLRARIIRALRSFFESRGFLEVETPQRIPANAPEEHIEPIRSADMYLHTSPEICMKRLLCRGHDKIFQICRCWRSGERGSRHLPEFTMLEWYRANSDYADLMRDCEELFRYVSETLIDSITISYNTTSIPCDEIFTRISVRDAFREWSDVSMEDAVRDGSFDEIMVTRIEPALEQTKPVLLVDYPIEMAALARPKPEDASVAERFELYAGGLELANGFSELNDPAEQRSRFQEANRKRVDNGYPELPIPEPFLEELANMPPSAGIALGVDRLVMLFAGATRIDDVIAFTPESL
ncbi:MAG: EF-P lysine aminoacylase GenX [Desulfuromonadales bacterium]|nr:EF-P lysine aminoacylase GenX [Desulfuromonadales bacterium]